MRIAVCMKQVPTYSEGNMDEKTGVIIRKGLLSCVNVYDLAALETALQIKEKTGASISIFTMGPKTAEKVLREAYAMGADEGFLISDMAFAGADVLATSYTLMQAIQSAGEYDLILCGKQTTDGDTAQVSGALAKWMNIPHANWVYELVDVTQENIRIKYMMEAKTVLAQVEYPCLLSVEKSIFIPRMPSLKLKIASKQKEVSVITIHELEDKDPKNYGLSGSATKVKKIFPPERTLKKEIVTLEAKVAANYIVDILKGLEYIDEDIK